MKLPGNILKISIILMIVLFAAGSAYAADDSSSELDDDSGDDFELDEDLDDSDDDSDDDENLDDDDDSDDDLDDDENLDDDDNLDDDLDDNESDDGYSDFDYLEYKIMVYLERYGDCDDENWTQSDDFVNEYQIYLADSSNYTLNESAEGYKTYLKIFDSITSTFYKYNLTDNETAYLKFMIIYYLNHYGNVSADYEWNESESFENFTLPDFFATALPDIAKGLSTSGSKFHGHNDTYDSFYFLVGYSDVVNQTANGNHTIRGNHTVNGNHAPVEAQDSNNIFIFVLLLIFVVAVLIMI